MAPLIETLSTVSEVSVPTDVKLDAVIPLARVLPVRSAAAADADESAPINLPSDELYFKNLPSTFAVDL